MATTSLPHFLPKKPRNGFQDLEGQQFNRLSVEKFIGLDPVRYQSIWQCRCECGKVAYVTTSNLRRGSAQSCGCLKKDVLVARNSTHGRTNSPEFHAYSAAKTRCVNPQSQYFHRYGGRGIQFRFSSFEEFYAEIGARPSEHYSLDRIDNEGHYEPGNVKWASRIDQANNKATTIWLSRDGVTDTLLNWARKIGIPAPRIRGRLLRGWCDDCSLSDGTSIKCRHRGDKR